MKENDFTDRPKRIELGNYRGHFAILAVSRESEKAPAPADWGVNLYIPRESGENVDIARVDTDHSGVHIDRFYLPEGHPDRRQDYSIQYTDPKTAIEREFLNDGLWKHYIDRYIEEHGL